MLRIAARFVLTILVLLCALALATYSAAQPSAGPAALLVFPRIVVDAGVDTIVQLGNASDQPVEVRCLYESATQRCTRTGSCLPDRRSCDGFCEPRWTTIPFRVRLTANQPLAWSVARGLLDPPLDGTNSVGVDGASNLGTRVPGLVSPFGGALRCVVVDDAGRPTDLNVLAGVASIESAADAPPPLDAAQYNAIGLAAVVGANNGDEILTLGGSEAEYAACPSQLVLSHFSDGAVVAAGEYAGTVATTLALVPCGGDLLGADGPVVVLQALIFNEYQQRFSTSFQVFGELASQLSLLDTDQPDRSAFSAGVVGTLTSQTEFIAVGGGSNASGAVAIALETHRYGDAHPPRHAAVPVPADGVDTTAAVLLPLHPACLGDCDGDGQVQINELLLAVNVALDATQLQACSAADGDSSGTVFINELTGAVSMALSKCPKRRLPTPTPGVTYTPTSPPPTPGHVGPDIVFIGIASGDDAPQVPVGFDDDNRPIFSWPNGQGFSLVIEARPGTDGRLPGRMAMASSVDELPDLQVILSNPIGDGSAAVCDADPPTLGGVPATDPFEFGDTPEAAHTINDLGCRTDDGAGEPQGRNSAQACTRLQPSGDVSPVSRATTVQFCIPIARAWAFPEGDTIVAARVRNLTGTVGPPREMVVRIASEP